jgi:uncharacterized membrane protein (UPF0127 family)
MRFSSLAVVLLCLCGCRNPDATTTSGAVPTRAVRMPDGAEVQAEVMVTAVDMQRGMMFREALPQGRGMLFIHSEPGTYRYWMYQVKVPLDIVFLDNQQRVLGVSANTPPCTTRASDCPNYGGYPGTRYVLELGAGEAQRYRIERGKTLLF